MLAAGRPQGRRKVGPCGAVPHLPGLPWRSSNRSLDSGPLSFFYAPEEGSPIAFRELRVNDQIRIPTVRLFDDTTGEQLGILPIERARELAAERELDLAEVAPLAQPPAR